MERKQKELQLRLEQIEKREKQERLEKQERKEKKEKERQQRRKEQERLEYERKEYLQRLQGEKNELAEQVDLQNQTVCFPFFLVYSFTHSYFISTTKYTTKIEDMEAKNSILSDQIQAITKKNTLLEDHVRQLEETISLLEQERASLRTDYSNAVQSIRPETPKTTRATSPHIWAEPPHPLSPSSSVAASGKQISRKLSINLNPADRARSKEKIRKLYSDVVKLRKELIVHKQKYKDSVIDFKKSFARFGDAFYKLDQKGVSDREALEMKFARAKVSLAQLEFERDVTLLKQRKSLSFFGIVKYMRKTRKILEDKTIKKIDQNRRPRAQANSHQGVPSQI